MKNNIKTNLKLAAVCSAAAMTLAGCVKRDNVIENISSDKILFRDVTDGTERIVECGSSPNDRGVWEYFFKYSHVGDTVGLKLSRHRYNNHDKYKCFTFCIDVDLDFNNKLCDSRREQAKFDSLKCVIVRESQEKQK